MNINFIGKDFDKLKQNNGIDDVYLPKNSIEENYDQKFDSLEQINSRRSSISKKSCCDNCLCF